MSRLLMPSDPKPAWKKQGDQNVPLLIVCDHASNVVPQSLSNLGVSKETLSTHIAWDIGARRVAEEIIERVGGCGVFAGYSRLVIDCNRPLRNSTLVPTEVDGISIPGNVSLSREDVGERIEEIYLPYHLLIAETLGAFSERGIKPFVLAVHSCTPQMNGFNRPWQIGIAHSKDEQASRKILNALKDQQKFEVGDNEPYEVDEDDYTILSHGMDRGLMHTLIEIRQDQISDKIGAETWGARLSDVLKNLALV